MNTLVQVRTAKRPVGGVLLAGYLALYTALLAAMHRTGSFEVGEPLLVFAILGIGFSLAAWLMTLRVSPLAYDVAEPKAELGTVVAYLVPVVAFITWGLAFLQVLGRGLHDVVAAHVSPSTLALGFPITFVWLALEAGVVEEFFFRVLLQTRLAAVLKSELGGIVLMSLLFGLAHAPGIYLRTGLTQEG